MADDPPIACTLAASEMPERVAEMRAIGRGALASATIADSEAILRFRSGGETLGRLQTVVAAESECCPFLRFDLNDADDGIVLRVWAPEGAEPVMEGIAEAFRGESPPDRLRP